MRRRAFQAAILSFLTNLLAALLVASAMELWTA